MTIQVIADAVNDLLPHIAKQYMLAEADHQSNDQKENIEDGQAHQARIIVTAQFLQDLLVQQNPCHGRSVLQSNLCPLNAQCILMPLGLQKLLRLHRVNTGHQIILILDIEHDRVGSLCRNLFRIHRIHTVFSNLVLCFLLRLRNPVAFVIMVDQIVHSPADDDRLRQIRGDNYRKHQNTRRQMPEIRFGVAHQPGKVFGILIFIFLLIIPHQIFPLCSGCWLISSSSRCFS